MRKRDLVNEVLSRMGVRLSRTSHGTYYKERDGIGCEVLCRDDCGRVYLETVWALRTSSARVNAARASEVLAQLRATGRADIHYRPDPVVHYVGLRENVPAQPTPQFFDNVRENADWVRNRVNSSSLS